MKRYFDPSVVVLCGALVSGALSGCTPVERPNSTAVVNTGVRPSEVKPRPPVRTRSKQTEPVVPITVAKVAPTPSPSAKSKTRVKPQAKSVLTNTTVTLNLFVASSSCPPDVEEIAAVARCYQITSLSNGLTPSVGLNSTALGVFSGGSASLSFTLTPGVPSSLNLSFPSSTAGMQTVVIITGQGEGQSGTVDFSGAEILVVNQ